ncbi:MAG: hypothetical protein VSS52_004010, partial [Thiotrichaceae bacterium]|nr:hypothetical protein [Thiotrichaceae bacterium]
MSFKQLYLIFLGLFYFSLSHAAELTFIPTNPTVEVNQKIALSVSGTEGLVLWSTFKGEIRGEGRDVIYVAPNEIGKDTVTVLDSADNTKLLSITIIPDKKNETPPILRIETGMHTATIKQISVDANEQFLLTASEDKTLRLWDLNTGNLLKTYRVPIGTTVEGKLYSGVISPNADWVAGAGYTRFSTNDFNIYIFNRANGQMIQRLSGLEN